MESILTKFHKSYVIPMRLWSNLLWPGDNIWRHKTWSSLVQVMTCFLTAPSHYLNQCWLIISEALWHSPKCNFPGNAHGIYPWYEFENFWFNNNLPGVSELKPGLSGCGAVSSAAVVWSCTSCNKLIWWFRCTAVLQDLAGNNKMQAHETVECADVYEGTSTRKHL